MRPSVLAQMQLTDGSVHTFEVSGDKIHALRFNVAKALYDVRLCCYRLILCGKSDTTRCKMQEVEKSKVLQIGVTK
jgi:hypothetical protein